MAPGRRAPSSNSLHSSLPSVSPQSSREDLWRPATFTSILRSGEPAEKKIHPGFLYMDILLRVHLSSLTDAGNRCEYQGHSALPLFNLGFTTAKASSLHWSEVAPAQKESSRGCQHSSSEQPSRLESRQLKHSMTYRIWIRYHSFYPPLFGHEELRGWDSWVSSMILLLTLAEDF